MVALQTARTTLPNYRLKFLPLATLGTPCRVVGGTKSNHFVNIPKQTYPENFVADQRTMNKQIEMIILTSDIVGHNIVQYTSSTKIWNSMVNKKMQKLKRHCTTFYKKIFSSYHTIIIYYSATTITYHCQLDGEREETCIEDGLYDNDDRCRHWFDYLVSADSIEL